MRKTIYLATMAIATASAIPSLAASLVCGGVGNDERREMAAAAGNASMSLQFSLAGRGNFVADVDVRITPAKGEAFSAKTDGPICYLQLPPGRYTVEASYKGTRKSTSATVPAAGGKPTRIAMSFPAGASDIDPGPVSTEEKLQASKP